MPSRCVSLVLSCLFVAGVARAGGPAQIEAVRGILLASPDGKDWKSLSAGAGVPAGQALLALFDADIRSANGAVALRLRSDLGEVGPLPALEAVAHIGENPKADLDVTLDRGVIVFRNMKKEGTATVVLRFAGIQGEEFRLTLEEPGTKMGVEAYSHHAPGVDAIRADQPTQFVFMLVSEGSALISHGDKTLSLKAPPGPAFLRWDSIVKSPEIEFLKTLPEWARRTPEETKAHERIGAAFAAAAASDSPVVAAAKLAKGDDALLRKAGVAALGALDRLDELGKLLDSSKEADVRNEAILVLRHWLGRQPGQIKKLESALAQAGLSPNQSATVLTLLIGFDQAERARPGTYALLLGELDHPRLAIRSLAAWHLRRLVPAGNSIAYDPAATNRQAAVAQWRRLIPAGELPNKR
ncbi:MAG TPA: hypothetical protein VHR72_04825 [Gemmataceae bacterium]|jgi:hypothetical protein|nr:hypothetical protein [Gemmataceae bacterium]